MIRSIVSTSNEQAIQDFADQGILSSISKILDKYNEDDKSFDQIDVEIQSDMLFILSCVCENDLHRKVGYLFSLVYPPEYLIKEN